MMAPGTVPPPVPLPLPNNGGAAGQPQPVSYPNAGNTRRPVRTTMPNMTANTTGNYGAQASYGAPVNYGAPTMTQPGGMPTVGNPGAPGGNPNVPQGPQTDADVVKQILLMQSQKDGPPVPTF